jgi:ubiquitin carboxyl-terminal hydrolase L3
MKQYAKNACGTIALFHVIMNNLYDYPDLVKEETYLTKFSEENFGRTPAEIGESFKINKDICHKHKESVKKGQTKVQSKVETHFIAFIEKDGFLYELDGRKTEPINHGECTPEGLTFMACLVISKFMQRDPNNNKFTILALGQKPEF